MHMLMRNVRIEEDLPAIHNEDRIHVRREDVRPMCKVAQTRPARSVTIVGKIGRSSMTNTRIVLFTLLCVLCARQVAVAQESLQYRQYALGASFASVLTTSGVNEREVRTLHERPALIQEFEWRAPYGQGERERPDSVRHIRFSFFDDQLYRMVVTYDRVRIEGLTNTDIVESLTATYGAPLIQPTPNSRVAVPTSLRDETTVVAQWEKSAALLTLTRGGVYSPEVQLSLISTVLDQRARDAIVEAVRLDAAEAPQRERARLAKQTEDAETAAQKARATNQPVFQP
jgi:hypothetical protein